MSFCFQSPTIDIGETPIENIFINNFMNMADEYQLKVYLAGVHFAKAGSYNAGNVEIAKLLGIELKKVSDAWRFWKALRVVDFEEPVKTENDSDDTYVFDVKFLSLRECYLESNYVLKCSDKARIQSEDYSKILKQRNMIELFEKIEKISNSPLDVDDRIKIIESLSKFSVDQKMLLRAAKITYIENPPNKPSLKYVLGILSTWAKKGLKTVEQVEADDEEHKLKIEFYKNFKFRLFGIYDVVTIAQAKIIDECLEISGDEKFILELADACTLWYQRPSFKRFKYMFDEIKENFSLSKEGLEKYMDSKQSKKTGKKTKNTKTANFKQKTYENMTSEDGIKAMKKRNPALGK